MIIPEIALEKLKAKMEYRNARHTNNLKPIVEFYTKIIGLKVLFSFENHNDYSGSYIDYTNEQYLRLSESHKQTGMITVQLASDKIGVPGFKFEEDVVEMLQKYEIVKLPEKFHDIYFNLAYNTAANMERRLQLLDFQIGQCSHQGCQVDHSA